MHIWNRKEWRQFGDETAKCVENNINTTDSWGNNWQNFIKFGLLLPHTTPAKIKNVSYKYLAVFVKKLCKVSIFPKCTLYMKLPLSWLLVLELISLKQLSNVIEYDQTIWVYCWSTVYYAFQTLSQLWITRHVSRHDIFVCKLLSSDFSFNLWITSHLYKYSILHLCISQTKGKF